MNDRAAVRLLVVDDEAALMQALCNTLQQQGYRSTGCCSAAEALERLKRERFDLLLTDLMMPVTDGLALARAALVHDPAMVVVMMTGQGSIPTAVQAMQSGVLDYVLKPFKLGTMLPVLQRALAMGALRRENAALQESLATHARALEDANRELEAFAAAASHDLRAPLRSMDGLTQLLARKLDASLTTDTRYLLELLGNCSRRGQRLVEDLLRLSQVSRQPLARSVVDVDSLVREVVAELVADSPQRAAIDVAIEGPLPTVEADAALLRQVFVNLLGNALKFSQRSATARVTVCSELRDGQQVFSVADSGPGFDMAEAARLFSPFERLTGAQDFEGSGIGLSIVKRIVDRHGGRIHADAAPGHGARFHFTLAGAANRASAA